jgi:hypothetical protein
MPRPPKQPARSEIDPAELELHDKVVARALPVGADPTQAVDVGCYFGALLHSPPFAANRQDMSSLVRTAGERGDTYSHADREFVDQVLSVYLKTNVIQLRHIPDALAVGIRIEAIDALRAGRDEDLNEDELALATYIRQVVDGEVTDESWNAMEQRLGTRGLVEYTYFITALHLTMRQYQAFGCYDPSEEEIDELLRGFREGTRALPDWRESIR